jgi:hypothetical protein
MPDPPDLALAEELARHLLVLEGTVCVLARSFGVPSYDFDLERFFACTHPVYLPEGTETIARLGPIADYEAVHEVLEAIGIHLVNDPDASYRANDLRGWYPVIADITARSLWFDGEPDLDRVALEIGFPVFVKTVQPPPRGELAGAGRQRRGFVPRVSRCRGPSGTAEEGVLLGSACGVVRAVVRPGADQHHRAVGGIEPHSHLLAFLDARPRFAGVHELDGARAKWRGARGRDLVHDRVSALVRGGRGALDDGRGEHPRLCFLPAPEHAAPLEPVHALVSPPIDQVGEHDGKGQAAGNERRSGERGDHHGRIYPTPRSEAGAGWVELPQPGLAPANPHG